MFLNMFGGYVQNFTSIFQVLYELQVFEWGNRSHFLAREFDSVNFLTCLACNNLSCTTPRTLKFSGVKKIILWYVGTPKTLKVS